MKAKWKTITLDAEAYAIMKRAKRPRESFGDVVRRVIEDPVDIDAYLADLIANPPKVDTELLRRRQANPPRSQRPAHWKKRPHAA